MTVSRSVHVLPMAPFHSFSWLSNIPWSVWPTSPLSVLLSVDIEDIRLHPRPGSCERCCSERGGHVSLWIMVLLGCMPRSAVTGSCGASVFSFVKTLMLFSIVAASLYMLNNSVGGFPFLHTLSSVYCLQIFFFILSCMSCLCILEINALSAASFANIFSRFKDCLFVLFMNSFVVQKLLSVTGPSWFIFVLIFYLLGGGSERSYCNLCQIVFCLCFPLRVL